jgi:thioredoxin 1
MDINLDIASRYQVPLDRGVPALAVLSDKGKLLYSQKAANSKPCAAWTPPP